MIATGALAPLRELMATYARDREVRSVAVLGNAPLEPSDARADQIDGADLVIRVNSFVLDRPGRPRAQGSRADVVVFSRMIQATSDFFAGYRSRLYVMLEPMRMYGRPEMWPQSWPRDLGHVVARNDAVAVPLNEELGLPWREERLAPTSGTTAAWLAITCFPDADVRIAGLSFVDNPEQTTWQHQWGDEVKVGPEHRIAAEAQLIRGWIDTGRARLLQ